MARRLAEDAWSGGLVAGEGEVGELAGEVDVGGDGGELAGPGEGDGALERHVPGEAAGAELVARRAVGAAAPGGEALVEQGHRRGVGLHPGVGGVGGCPAGLDDDRQVGE